MTFSHAAPVLVFDFADRGGAPRRLYFTSPREILVAESPGEVPGVLGKVEEAARAGLYAAGYVAYEAAPAFDPALAVRAGAKVPPAWFGLFDSPAPDSPPASRGGFEISAWAPGVGRDEYRRNVARVREAVARGDSYQVNYTFRMRARFRGDDFALYELLAANQRTPFCAYLDTGRFRVLSASPELFFRRRHHYITTRPMKGTARRGRWAEEDEEIAARLAASEKERAENVMIVDLLRNDLGRVAEFGSIVVRDLCTVERYPTVFQMTSTVEARARAGVSLADLFAATFPCGSVTGAPKVSTSRLIAALEDSPRNIYCGSIGLVAPGGEAVFNVAIRTLLLDAETGEAEYGVGGGITWDSEADAEYEEALAKAAVLTEARPPFELIETLRLERGHYALLERHLKRLRDSARYFDFDDPTDAARSELSQLAASAPPGPLRVRLLASPNGKVRVESAPLEDLPEGPLPVALALSPVRRAERFLYHKTTRREFYDIHRAARPEAFDVLLWNEDGELTEFTHGNVVVEIDGRRLTPARGCGLLAGTMRAELLESGEIREAVISRARLESCTMLWFVNSVRGLAPARLMPAPF